jgi:hypothetical protein
MTPGLTSRAEYTYLNSSPFHKYIGYQTSRNMEPKTTTGNTKNYHNLELFVIPSNYIKRAKRNMTETLIEAHSNYRDQQEQVHPWSSYVGDSASTACKCTSLNYKSDQPKCDECDKILDDVMQQAVHNFKKKKKRMYDGFKDSDKADSYFPRSTRMQFMNTTPYFDKTPFNFKRSSLPFNS